MKTIIFTDLDGTLLDHETYSFEEAFPALSKIKQTQTPLIFITSKTFAEVKALQEKMGLWGKEPFVIESGGALFIPKDLFEFDLRQQLKGGNVLTEGNFWKVEFGAPYKEVRKVLKEAAKEVGLEVRGIGDMTAEEFAAETGLSVEEAKRAKQRKYQEGFKILVPPDRQAESHQKIKKALKKRGYHLSRGGRYYQIMNKPAKIEAVKNLITLFRKKYRQIQTIGLGDAPADLEFLKLCDRGYLVKNPAQTISPAMTDRKISRLKEEGPKGWNQVILTQLAKDSAKN